ncbi:MAG: FAD/NAD(P)-binding protein [Alphaproteobacteria bacterium]|nr:FAD/NAD(P)-binding protein [Alphaproteobacteria bacterium]
MSNIYDVAIVGGGFAGLMVAANLVLRDGPEHDRPRPSIYWADAQGHDFGTAYRTREPHHLLNVRADKMSAWLGGGADFARWLEPHYPGQYPPESYVPRMVYAQYLSTIRIKMAAALGDRLTLDHNMMVAGAQRGSDWQLTGADGTAITARHLVLATGNPALSDPGWPQEDRFIRDAWAWRLNGGTAPDAPHIVVMGTGLTAIDMILSLRADGYTGPITAVSPSGKFPHVHADPVASYEAGRAMIAAMMGQRTARGYMRLLREHIKKANGDWRSVIGSVRDHTVMLWQVLPENEKARFMRHLWSRWNIHRHRMSPDIHAQLQADTDLTIVSGRVAVDAAGVVPIRPKTGATYNIDSAAVINCTGPDYRRIVAGNDLLANLFGGGYIAPGPLGLGIAQPVIPGLHAIGTALLGERLETTAVPDLRQQAAAIATRIAAAL